MQVIWPKEARKITFLSEAGEQPIIRTFIDYGNRKKLIPNQWRLPRCSAKVDTELRQTFLNLKYWRRYESKIYSKGYVFVFGKSGGQFLVRNRGRSPFFG